MASLHTAMNTTLSSWKYQLFSDKNNYMTSSSDIKYLVKIKKWKNTDFAEVNISDNFAL